MGPRDLSVFNSRQPGTPVTANNNGMKRPQAGDQRHKNISGQP
jgi:hypothetical protein